MKKAICRIFLVFILGVIGVSLPSGVVAHSGGGGGSEGSGEGGGNSSNLATYQGSASTFVSELSSEELNTLMSGLNVEDRDLILADYSQWPANTTVKQLIALIDTGVPVSVLTEKDIEALLSILDQKTREYLLIDFVYWTKDLSVSDLKQTVINWAEGDRVRANMAASITDKAATVVEIVDEVGEKTQTVLGYCPGVGLATAVTLDTVREAANSRKKGKDSGEIAKDAGVKFMSSLTTNYVSKADGILDIAVKGTKEKAAQLAVYLGIKVAEGKAGSALEDTTRKAGGAVNKKNLEIAATFVNDLVYGQSKRENKVAQPTYSTSPGFAPGQTHQTRHTAQ